MERENRLNPKQEFENHIGQTKNALVSRYVGVQLNQNYLDSLNNVINEIRKIYPSIMYLNYFTDVPKTQTNQNNEKEKKKKKPRYYFTAPLARQEELKNGGYI